jgi:formylglycine-generating enzyme required for sulfatase activity
LSPAFSANTLNYTVNVPSDVTSMNISATKADSKAVLSECVTVGSGTATGQATLPLNGPGTATLALITVIAPNGSSKIYRITVKRAAPAGNNNLSGLTVAPGPLTPAFTAATTNYTVDVASTVTSITVTPTRQDANATITVNGQPTNSGQVQANVLSGPGTNTVTNIVVTAPNGAQKTYAVEVSRAVKVEPEPERLEPTMASAVDWDSPSGSFSSQGETKFSGVSQESAQAGSVRHSLPYLTIGLGILAAIGALVYFVVFPQGRSLQYQSAVQPSITGKDCAPMVLVPAGEFMMGSRDGVQDDERPVHSEYLDAYYIDEYEVTTARYAKFFKETNRRQPEYWSENVVSAHASKPVVGVDWNDAAAYCAWAGKRLPTEAEWEKAARGNDQRPYPWGKAEPSPALANYDHCCDFKEYGALTDVGSFEQGKSPYGAYDMAGNVWEWVADWYDRNYYENSPVRNPTGPSSGQVRVLRGGSWIYSPVGVRSADRFWFTPTTQLVEIGFRCAQGRPKLTCSL